MLKSKVLTTLKRFNRESPKNVTFKYIDKNNILGVIKDGIRHVSVTLSIDTKIPKNDNIINRWFRLCTHISCSLKHERLDYSVLLIFQRNSFVSIKSFTSYTGKYSSSVMFSIRSTNCTSALLNTECRNLEKRLSEIINNKQRDCIELEENSCLYTLADSVEFFNTGGITFLCISDKFYIAGESTYITDILSTNIKVLSSIKALIEENSIEGFIVKFNKEYDSIGVQIIKEDSILRFNDGGFIDSSWGRPASTKTNVYHRECHYKIGHGVSRSLFISCCCAVLSSVIEEKLSSIDVNVKLPCLSAMYGIKDILRNKDTYKLDISLCAVGRLNTEVSNIPFDISSIIVLDSLKCNKYIDRYCKKDMIKHSLFSHNGCTYNVYTFESDNTLKKTVLSCTINNKYVTVTKDITFMCDTYNIL